MSRKKKERKVNRPSTNLPKRNLTCEKENMQIKKKTKAWLKYFFTILVSLTRFNCSRAN